MEFRLQKRANAHNEGISNEIIAKFENRVLNGIGRNYLSDNNFYDLFMKSKESALDEVCCDNSSKIRNFVDIVFIHFLNSAIHFSHI